jgi:hypothetical protein
MIHHTAIVERFGSMGEKTGWTYVTIPAAIARLIKDDRRSFRVKGTLAGHPIAMVALIPMGEGDFILPLNDRLRRGMGPAAREGNEVDMVLELDLTPQTIDEELLLCLADEPHAMQAFEAMPRSHQRYFSKWVQEAKTAPTRAKRIAMTVEAMLRGFDFGQMLRHEREQRNR